MPRHVRRDLDPALVESIRRAAEAEAEVPEEEKPDYVDIGGVRYYRTRQVVSSDPAKPEGTPEGFSRIMMNLAPFAPYIRINNRLFFADQTYTIPDEDVPTFLEIMQRTWQHEQSTGGANSKMIGQKNLTYNVRSTAQRSTLGVPGISG